MSPWLLLLLFVGLLQTTLLAPVTLFGAHPNLVLSVVVSWGLLRGGREGLIWGMGGGIVLDLLSSAPFGVFTIALLLTSFVTSLTEFSLFRPTLALPVGTMLVASPLFQLVAMVMMQTLGWPVSWARGWALLLPTALADAVLTLLLFPLMRRLSHLAGERAIEWGG